MATATTTPTIPVDGFTSLLGGMHAGLDPEVLTETGYSRGINVMCRGGLLRTRPGFAPAKQLPNGVFQGMATWTLHSGPKIVSVISGTAYVYDASTGALKSFALGLSPTSQCYLCQAERFFIIQDGSSTPVVLQEKEGVIGVRPEAHTIPIGTAMTFAHGRIHLTPNLVPGTSENGRPYILSGDVFLAVNPASILDFTETGYLSEGGAHGLPMEMGYVQAFAPLKNAATGTGYGGVVVFAERGVSAFDFSAPRDEWNSTSLAQVLYFGPGTTSPWSVIPVNGTLIYRAPDGMRILSYAVSAAQSTGDTLSMIPQSTEVAPYMPREDKAYLPYVSAAVSDNRVFMTVGGADDRWFKAMIVLDAARVTQMSSAAGETAYDGIWQVEGKKIGGIVSCVVDGEDTLFCLMDDFQLWKLDSSAKTDNGAPIHSRVVTRAMFTDTPNLKRLSQTQLWFRDLVGDITATVYYRPAGYPLWAAAGSVGLKVAPGSLFQRRRGLGINIDQTQVPADPSTGELICLAQNFQFCIDISGSMVLNMFRALGTYVSEPAPAPCSETTGVKIEAGAAGIEIGEYL